MWFTTPDHPFKIANLKTKIKRKKNECECENTTESPNCRKWSGGGGGGGGEAKKANWEFMNFNPGLFRYGRRCSSVQNLDLSCESEKQFRRCNSAVGDLKPDDVNSLEVPPKEVRGRTFPNLRGIDPSTFMCESSSFLFDLYRCSNLRASSDGFRRNFSERNLGPLPGDKNWLDNLPKYKSQFNLSSVQQKARRSSFFHRSNQSLKKKNSLREQDEDDMIENCKGSEKESQNLNNIKTNTNNCQENKVEKKNKNGKRNKKKKEEKKKLMLRKLMKLKKLNLWKRSRKNKKLQLLPMEFLQ